MNILLENILNRYPTDIRKHAERVADMVKPYGKDYEMVALLHDIIEDTDTNILDLNFLQFDIVVDISTLTRQPDEKYFEYIDFITNGSKRAITVKYYDILDHLHNKATLKPSLKKRYLKAKEILEGVM